MASRRYAPITANRLYRADIRARRVLTLMADRGRGEAILFITRIRGTKSAVVTAALFCCSRCDTTQATSQVRHPIHADASAIINRFIVLPCVKTPECQRAIPRRFDPTTQTDKFCQMPDKTGELSYSRTVNPSSLEIACAVSRNGLSRFFSPICFSRDVDSEIEMA